MPKGVYKVTEDNDREIEENTNDDGPVPLPSTEVMAKMDSWCHYTPNILK